jgi:uncharacterized membrane protein SirB2
MLTTDISPALKHPHQTFAFLFVGYFFYKAILLFLNKEEALDKQRSNKVMKILFDMVFPTIAVILGITMAVKAWGANPADWKLFAILKMMLVLMVIPVGMIAMRKKNKAMTAACCLMMLAIIVLAYAKI